VTRAAAELARISFPDLRARVLAGGRVTPEEGLYLLTRAPLIEMGMLAREIRNRRHPADRVTYVVDTNPNYTNVCDADCQFCAFYRKPGDTEEGYWHSIDEMLEMVGQAVKLGATTLLLQGGLNDEIPFDWYLDLVRALKAAFPGLHLHLFSAPEIGKMAEVSGLPTQEVLSRLKEAGLMSLPGGGAEILTERVRKRISPKKQSHLDWLRIHREAHEVGLPSTATMMYGHFDGPEDVVEHLEHVRALQDETGGFTAFIPWSFKPENTLLHKWITDEQGAIPYLRVLALARIYLDNVDHVQASWFSEGKAVGQIALHFGADDFGGTLIEENVLKAANFDNTTTTEETLLIIREAGFEPVQRTTAYRLVEAEAL
jgi:cyclic dehypoxanthinyl futalosine synthase